MARFVTDRIDLKRRFARAARPFAVLAAGAAAALVPLAARAGGIETTYDISLAGIPIGIATLKARLDDGTYKVEMHARLTGVAGVFATGKGGATAEGAINGARLSPASLAVLSSTGDATRSLRMALAGNAVQAVEIKPPLEDWEKPDRVPVTDAHRRGVIDPLSAILMPVSGGGLAAACNRTLPIFDGATRFNVVLTYVGTKSVSKPGYSGPAAVCRARYVPLAGHRPLRRVTKFMEENRDMETWLVPVAGTNVYVPYRISIKTMIGTTTLEASQFAMDGAGHDGAVTASVPAKKSKARN